LLHETQPVKPSLRVTVTLKGFGQRPINGASILDNRTRSKQLFHTSQNRPFFCAFYWVTTFSSAKRVSGWPRERNIGGVTGELRRLGLTATGYGWGSDHCPSILSPPSQTPFIRNIRSRTCICTSYEYPVHYLFPVSLYKA
jgi:hypothetical protein